MLVDDIFDTPRKRPIIFLAFYITADPMEISPLDEWLQMVNTEVKIMIPDASDINSNLFQKRHHLLAFEKGGQGARSKNIATKED